MRSAAISIVLVALCLAVFGQVRKHELVDWDDPIDISGNPLLASAPSRATLAEAFTSPYHGNWIPLTQLSLVLSRALGGMQPASFLLGNVLLHALAAVTLFLALARMTAAPGRSAFVAAIFAVHPLHVESVAWASERKDVLAGLFFAGTLYAYARFAERTGSKWRYALVLLLIAGGLLSKPTVVTLPGVLLLLDFWPLGRLHSDPRAGARRVLLEKLPMLVLVAAASGVTLLVQHSGGGMEFAQRELPLSLRLWNALQSYSVYFGQAVWPVGLTVFYPHPAASLSRGAAALSGIALAATSAAALALTRRFPYLLVGWFWYLITLLPVIGIVQVGMQSHADRYMYLPLSGLAIALAWGAVDWVGSSPARRRALACAAAAVVALLAIAAHRQTESWRDSVTLFGRAVALDPSNLVAQHRLAAALRHAGRLDEAQQRYEETIAREPRWAQPRLELGGLLEDRGVLDAALQRYQEGVQLDPGHVEGQASIGRVLLKMRRFAEARVEFERTLALDPELPAVHAMLAVAAQQLGSDADSIRHNREAIAREPGLLSALNNLAWSLAASHDSSLRDPEGAVRVAERAVAKLPQPDPAFLDTLAVSYAAAGRFEDAVRTATRAADLADERGEKAMASEIRGRIALFRARRAWIDPAREVAPG